MAKGVEYPDRVELRKCECGKHIMSSRHSHCRECNRPNPIYTPDFSPLAAAFNPLEKPAAKVAEGLRYDTGKVKFELLPPEAIWALARHYEVGSRKYAERNWEKGMKWGKPFACLMRHAWKWMRGEEFDEETGSHHMICVMWNAAAIFTYYVRNIGEDDRPQFKSPNIWWKDPTLPELQEPKTPA